MNAKDAIRSSANLSTMVLKTYISDLDDADLMRRPGEGCNHLAWQLGHLISSEVQLLDRVAPGQGTELPDGFAVRTRKRRATTTIQRVFTGSKRTSNCSIRFEQHHWLPLMPMRNPSSTTRRQKTIAISARPWVTRSR